MVAKEFQGIPIEGELSNRALLGKLNHLENFKQLYFGEEEEKEDEIVPFVACGDPNTSFDSDMNYSLLQST